MWQTVERVKTVNFFFRQAKQTCKMAEYEHKIIQNGRCFMLYFKEGGSEIKGVNEGVKMGRVTILPFPSLAAWKISHLLVEG